MIVLKSSIHAFIKILFSPKRFFKDDFLNLSAKELYIIGFFGVFLGLSLGSLISIGFNTILFKNFLVEKEVYLTAIKGLGLNEQGFIDLLKMQKSYSILLIVLSPLLAYIAPHLLGGALFLFLWLFTRPEKIKIDFMAVLECAAISLTAMAYYCVPVIGPFIAIVMLGVNLSRALLLRFQIIGFMKMASILSALYICTFLLSASLQMLALPFSALLERF